MDRLVSKHLQEIKNLFVKHGVKSAYLFGSAAKGTLQKNSDIDFLYSFPDDMDFEEYANNYFDLADSLETLLDKKVELVAEKTLKNPYLIESINESKIRLL
jgi:uncharacterized protein